MQAQVTGLPVLEYGEVGVVGIFEKLPYVTGVGEAVLPVFAVVVSVWSRCAAV